MCSGKYTHRASRRKPSARSPISCHSPREDSTENRPPEQHHPPVRFPRSHPEQRSPRASRRASNLEILKSESLYVPGERPRAASVVAWLSLLGRRRRFAAHPVRRAHGWCARIEIPAASPQQQLPWPRRPISRFGWRTVVSGGSVYCADVEIVEPHQRMSSGTRRPLTRECGGSAPRAVMSL